jgi:hypothetical protein
MRACRISSSAQSERRLSRSCSFIACREDGVAGGRCRAALAAKNLRCRFHVGRADFELHRLISHWNPNAYAQQAFSAHADATRSSMTSPTVIRPANSNRMRSPTRICVGRGLLDARRAIRLSYHQGAEPARSSMRDPTIWSKPVTNASRLRLQFRTVSRERAALPPILVKSWCAMALRQVHRLSRPSCRMAVRRSSFRSSGHRSSPSLAKSPPGCRGLDCPDPTSAPESIQPAQPARDPLGEFVVRNAPPLPSGDRGKTLLEVRRAPYSAG